MKDYNELIEAARIIFEDNKNLETVIRGILERLTALEIEENIQNEE